MSNEILEEIRKIRDSQERMEIAVLGDSELGVPGLVKRTGAVEGKVKALQNDRMKLIAWASGASFVLGSIGAYVFGR